MNLKLEKSKGMFLYGKITKKGLATHLEERVFVGENEQEITELMFRGRGPAQPGILRSLDGSFYIQVCRINRYKDYVDGLPIWDETKQRRLIKDGDVIRIWGKYKGHGRDYEVWL